MTGTNGSTYGGVYRAVCLEVLEDRARAQVPQLFADETVTIFEFAGGRPDVGDQGWVAFESQQANRPIWIGSESKGTGGGGTGPVGAGGYFFGSISSTSWVTNTSLQLAMGPTFGLNGFSTTANTVVCQIPGTYRVSAFISHTQGAHPAGGTYVSVSIIRTAVDRPLQRDFYNDVQDTYDGATAEVVMGLIAGDQVAISVYSDCARDIDPNRSYVMFLPVSTQGEPGPPGQDGTDGATGPTGATGATGAQGPQGVPGASSSLFYYTLSSVTVTPPANGEMRVNTATMAAAVTAWASYTTRDSMGVALIMSKMAQGMQLTVAESANASHQISYDIIGAPIDHGTYIEFPVTMHAQTPQPTPPAKGANIDVLVSYVSAGLPGAPGSKWWNGSGAPTIAFPPANQNDYYLNVVNGDVYAGTP